MVVVTREHSTQSVLGQVSEGRPTTDIILRKATGEAAVYVRQADGSLRETTPLADKTAVNEKLAEYRASGKKVVQVYEYGAHYGQDSATRATDEFTVIVGKDTTTTEFLQAVGRDRGELGKYSQLNAGGVGEAGSLFTG